MMSPEMMRAASEMMKNMKPEDLEAIQRQMQGMSPEQMQRMMSMGAGMRGAGGVGGGAPSPAAAAEMMKNMKPEDLDFIQRQMQNIPPEELQRMTSSMGGMAGPGFSAASVGGAAQMMHQRQKYELDAAKRLKDEGNKLHGAGNYDKAVEKYTRAKDNLASHSSVEALAVRKACMLNLMSCFLKLDKFKEVVSLGDEVVAKDKSNVKALYRRGQAYMKLGQLKSAVQDLRQAAQLSPGDETLAGVLRQAESELETKEGLGVSGNGDGDSGPREKGIQEDTQKSQQGSQKTVTSCGGVTIEDVTEEEAEETRRESDGQGSRLATGSSTSGPSSLDPNALRSIQMMSSLPPETVAALSGGAITPEMASMASKVVSSMPPEEVQRMMELAARFGPAAAASSGTGSAPVAGAGAVGRAPGAGAQPSIERGAGGTGAAAEGAASPSEGSQSRSSPIVGMPGGPSAMEDPQMVKAMAEMMKNISPEDLASMSQTMGMPMTVEQAKQTKDIMTKVGPENVAVMMKWTNRAHVWWVKARQKAQWILRQRALVIAILVVLVAITLKWLGYF